MKLKIIVLLSFMILLSNLVNAFVDWDDFNRANGVPGDTKESYTYALYGQHAEIKENHLRIEGVDVEGDKSALAGTPSSTTWAYKFLVHDATGGFSIQTGDIGNHDGACAFKLNDAGEATFYNGAADEVWFSVPQDEYLIITIHHNSGTDKCQYKVEFLNGTTNQTGILGAVAATPSAADYHRMIVNAAYGDIPFNASIDEWGACVGVNFTCLSFPLAPSTEPPNLDDSTWNLTSSDGGCTAWQTDKTTHCLVKDTTPTLTVDTDYAADCAVSVTDINYSTMTGGDADRNCTTTGSTTHICTLPVGDILTGGNNSLYVGCRSLTGYENATSNSGALAITNAYRTTWDVKDDSVVVENATVYVHYWPNMTILNSSELTNSSGEVSYLLYEGYYATQTVDKNNLSRGTAWNVNMSVP